MCIGIPMQVIRVEHSQAIVHGRGEQRRLDISLLDTVQPGDWVLAFLNDAREILDAERAREINQVLDLVQGAMTGMMPCTVDDPFELPSAMSGDALQQLVGQAPPVDPNEGESTHEHSRSAP